MHKRVSVHAHASLNPLVDHQHQENFKLRDQNDDLNAEILSLSLYEAKNLFSCQTKAQCLAAEIDNASKDEVSPLPARPLAASRAKPALHLTFSFPSPLSSPPVSQLVDALKEQEEINLRLRQYMDKIILAILDHNPSILEIKQ